MSLWGVILGTFGQGLLGYMLFMVVAFSPTGSDNLTPGQLNLLDLSLYLLPGSCLVSALIVLYGYRVGAGARIYWWYALPLLLTLIYVIYVLHLNRTTSSH